MCKVQGKSEGKYWPIIFNSVVVLVSVFLGYLLTSCGDWKKEKENNLRIKTAIRLEVAKNTERITEFIKEMESKPTPVINIRIDDSLTNWNLLIWQQYNAKAAMILDIESFYNTYEFFENLSKIGNISEKEKTFKYERFTDTPNLTQRILFELFKQTIHIYLGEKLNDALGGGE